MMAIISCRVAGVTSGPTTKFVKFSSVTSGIPGADVFAVVDENKGFLNNGFPLFFEEEDAVIDVIAVLQRNVTVQWLWTP
jgi:hypothetical protein